MNMAIVGSSRGGSAPPRACWPPCKGMPPPVTLPTTPTSRACSGGLASRLAGGLVGLITAMLLGGHCRHTVTAQPTHVSCCCNAFGFRLRAGCWGAVCWCKPETSESTKEHHQAMHQPPRVQALW